MKLYILFGNLTLGVIGYIIVEIRYRRKVISIGFRVIREAFNNLIFFMKNSNDDLRNKKPKKMPVKLKQLNNRLKSKKQTTNRTIWKKILKSLTSKLILEVGDLCYEQNLFIIAKIMNIYIM